MSLDLEDLVLAVAQNGNDVEEDVLRLHVLDEREGQLAGLAGLDVHVVAPRRQVAQDAGLRGRIFGERLGGGQGAAEEHDVNRGVLVVDNLHDRLGAVAVDEVHAKGRVGEDGGDVDLQFGNFGTGGGGFGLRLQ